MEKNSYQHTINIKNLLSVIRPVACSTVALFVLSSANPAFADRLTKTFSNTRSIKINDLCADPSETRCVNLLDFYNIRQPEMIVPSAKSGPYGTAIKVPNNSFPADFKIKDVNVTISGLNHKFLDDVDVLLVAPNGQYVTLISNVSAAGSTADGAPLGTEVNNVTWIFDDSALVPLPNSNINDGRLSTRTTSELYNVIYDEWVNVWTDTTPRRFKPSDYDSTNPADIDQFPEPVKTNLVTPPSALDWTTPEIAQQKVVTSGPSLSVFNGYNPAGVWKLYVVDDFFWYKGEITGGWSLEVTAGD